MRLQAGGATEELKKQQEWGEEFKNRFDLPQEVKRSGYEIQKEVDTTVWALASDLNSVAETDGIDDGDRMNEIRAIFKNLGEFINR